MTTVTCKTKYVLFFFVCLFLFCLLMFWVSISAASWAQAGRGLCEFLSEAHDATARRQGHPEAFAPEGCDSGACFQEEKEKQEEENQEPECQREKTNENI